MARHEMTPPPRSRIRHRTHRLIASRHPTTGIFDDLTDDPEELRVAFLLESATNDRFALLGSRLGVLPDAEIVNGPAANIVMAAFLHVDPAGGRFSDARLGAWYAAFDVATAIAETLFHSDRRLRHSAGAFPSTIQLRELIADIECRLCDIRGERGSRPELYDPDPVNYGTPQRFAAAIRWPADDGEPENGIVFDSVRREGGVNVCLFRPSLIPLPVLQGDHYEYRWDSVGTVNVVKITTVELGR